MKKILFTILFASSLFSQDLKNIHCDKLIKNDILNICYNYSAKSANYVEYTVKKDSVNSVNIKKRPRFYRDKHIPKLFSVSPSDYIYATDSKTEYLTFDRSHLAPDADFDYSRKSLLKVYTMANIVAMRDRVNRYTWENLEERERELAAISDTKVISGAIYEDKDLYLVKKNISEIIKIKQHKLKRELSLFEKIKLRKKYKKYNKTLKRKHILIPTKLYKIISLDKHKECYLLDNIKDKILSKNCDFVWSYIEQHTN